MLAIFVVEYMGSVHMAHFEEEKEKGGRGRRELNANVFDCAAEFNIGKNYFG